MPAALTRTIKSITEVLTMEQTEILKAAGLLMIPALLTKLTGLVFTLLTATQLGTGPQVSEFLLANELPQLLADILLTGAISTLVIPIFIQVKDEKGEKAFLKFYSTIVNITLGLFVLFSLIVLLFADAIFPFVLDYIIRPNPANYPSPESITNIIAMMRALMFPQLVLGISVFVAAALNVYDRYIVPQLAPLFYNIGRIFAVFILLPLMDKSPWALVAGVYIGAVLHLLVQLPLAKMLKLEYSFEIDWKSQYLPNFIRVTWPRLIAYTGDVLGGTMSRLIIAGYSVSFISVMFYAGSLGNIVPGIIGYAFSVASYPTLSRMYTRRQYQEINDIVIKIINQIVFLALPVLITLVILRLPVVRLVFGLLPATSFDRQDTLSVAWVLLFLSFGVIFIASKAYLYRLFYIAQNTLVPLFVSSISLVLTIFLTIMFANLMSHSNEYSVGAINLNFANLTVNGGGAASVGGAGLALSIAAAFEFTMLLLLVNRFVVRLEFKELVGRLARKLIPAGIATLLMYLMYKTWDTYSFPIDAQPGFDGSTTLNLFVLTSLTMFTCFMVYYLLCHLFGVEELKILRRILNPLFKLGGLHIK